MAKEEILGPILNAINDLREEVRENRREIKKNSEGILKNREAIRENKEAKNDSFESTGVWTFALLKVRCGLYCEFTSTLELLFVFDKSSFFT